MCFVYCYSNSQVQWTPLHCASRSGHVEVVKLLLTKGAEIDSKSVVSQTKEVNIGVIDWYFNDNLIKILFPDNVICGFINIMFSS